MLPGSMSLLQLESDLYVPRNLPLKFHSYVISINRINISCLELLLQRFTITPGGWGLQEPEAISSQFGPVFGHMGPKRGQGDSSVIMSGKKERISSKVIAIFLRKTRFSPNFRKQDFFFKLDMGISQLIVDILSSSFCLHPYFHSRKGYYDKRQGLQAVMGVIFGRLNFLRVRKGGSPEKF